MTVSEDRKKALEEALKQINKAHGDGTAMKLGDAPAMDVEMLTTGSLKLDIALGGGIPRGRIIEIYGNESVGKTLLASNIVANVQKNDGIAAFIDVENAYDPDFARKVGVNIDELVISQPSSGEQAFEVAETLIRSGAIDIIVVDSVAALIPAKELEGDFGDATMGSQARLISQAMRKLVSAISKSKTTVIFINQIRNKIGGYGNPETTTGGKALAFYASQRIQLFRDEQLKDGTEIVGMVVRAKVPKNKVAPPFKEAKYTVLFTAGNEGISKEADIRDLAVELGFVTKAGAFYTIGEHKAQGGEKARLYLAKNPEIADELDEKIREKLFNASTEEVQTALTKNGEEEELSSEDTISLDDLPDED